VHHLNDELRCGSGMRFQMRFAFRHRRHNIGIVIRHFVNDRTIGLELVGPATLVLELPVHRFPSLGLFLGIDQRIFRALVYRNVGAVGNLKQTEHVLRFFLHPLIPADGSDA